MKNNNEAWEPADIISHRSFAFRTYVDNKKDDGKFRTIELTIQRWNKVPLLDKFRKTGKSITVQILRHTISLSWGS